MDYLNDLIVLQTQIDDNKKLIGEKFNKMSLRQKFLCIDDGKVDVSTCYVNKNYVDAITFIKTRALKDKLTTFFISSEYQTEFLYYIQSAFRGFYKVSLCPHTEKSINDNIYEFLLRYAKANNLPLVRDENLYTIYFDDVIEWCKKYES